MRTPPGVIRATASNHPRSHFDMLTAVEDWVERCKAPDQIVASRSTRGAVDRTRPLCTYPKVAVYNGSGSTDDAANFSCRLPAS